LFQLKLFYNLLSVIRGRLYFHNSKFLEAGLIVEKKFQCKANEFTCTDGACIPLDNRCDIIKDCPDKSDENNCTSFDIDNYLKQDPPIKDRDGNGTSLEMKIIVSSFNHFNEMDMTFTARFSLQLKWYDWRVTFYNLKLSKDNFNYIGNSDVEKLWLPRLIFSNCVNEASLKFDDLSSVISRRRGPPTFNSPEEIQETESFDGDSNPLVYNRTFELELECNFQLEKYPFDYQRCYIDVSTFLYLSDLKLFFWSRRVFEQNF
jgi:hypothetical protein